MFDYGWAGGMNIFVRVAFKYGDVDVVQVLGHSAMSYIFGLFLVEVFGDEGVVVLILFGDVEFLEDGNVVVGEVGFCVRKNIFFKEPLCICLLIGESPGTLVFMGIAFCVSCLVC